MPLKRAKQSVPHSTYAWSTTSVSQWVWNVWPSGLELRPQLAEVVDLAVVGELHRPSSVPTGWWPPAGSMMARRRCPRLASGCSKKPSPSGPRCCDPAGHGGQEGGVGRAPEPGNATHGRRSLQVLAPPDRPPEDWPRFARWPTSRAASASPSRSPACRCTRTASGTRRSPRWASPTCGRRRPTVPTASRRWRSPPRGRRRCAAASPSCRCSPAVRHCSRSPRRHSPMPHPDGSRSGIGASSPAIVERWNGIPFEQPFRAHARHPAVPPSPRSPARRSPSATTPSRCRASDSASCPRCHRHSWWPRCARACCGSRARRATARSSTGCRRPTSPQVTPFVGDKEIVARIFVAPTDDFDHVRAMAVALDHELPQRRRLRQVPRVARSRPVLQPMWDAWAAGDRARALELVPDEVIDDLIVWGTPARIRERVEQLRRARRHHDRAGDHGARRRRCARRSARSRLTRYTLIACRKRASRSASPNTSSASAGTRPQRNRRRSDALPRAATSPLACSGGDRELAVAPGDQPLPLDVGAVQVHGAVADRRRSCRPAGAGTRSGTRRCRRPRATASSGDGVPAATLGVVAVHRGLLRPSPLPERGRAVGRRERPHRRVGVDRPERVDQRPAHRRGTPRTSASPWSDGVGRRPGGPARCSLPCPARRSCAPTSSPRRQCSRRSVTVHSGHVGTGASVPAAAAASASRSEFCASWSRYCCVSIIGRLRVQSTGVPATPRLSRAPPVSPAATERAERATGARQSNVSGSTCRISSASLLSGEFTRCSPDRPRASRRAQVAASPPARRGRRWWDRATCPSRASSSITGMREWIGLQELVGAAW